LRVWRGRKRRVLKKRRRKEQLERIEEFERGEL
jgi:hypothetical protein